MEPFTPATHHICTTTATRGRRPCTRTTATLAARLRISASPALPPRTWAHRFRLTVKWRRSPSGPPIPTDLVLPRASSTRANITFRVMNTRTLQEPPSTDTNTTPHSTTQPAKHREALLVSYHRSLGLLVFLLPLSATCTNVLFLPILDLPLLETPNIRRQQKGWPSTRAWPRPPCRW